MNRRSFIDKALIMCLGGALGIKLPRIKEEPIHSVKGKYGWVDFYATESGITAKLRYSGEAFSRSMSADASENVPVYFDDCANDQNKEIEALRKRIRELENLFEAHHINMSLPVDYVNRLGQLSGPLAEDDRNLTAGILSTTRRKT